MGRPGLTAVRRRRVRLHVAQLDEQILAVWLGPHGREVRQRHAVRVEEWCRRRLPQVEETIAVAVLHRRAIHDRRPRQAVAVGDAVHVHTRRDLAQRGVGRNREGRVVPARSRTGGERVLRDAGAVVREVLARARLAAADDVRQLRGGACVVEPLHRQRHAAGVLVHRVGAVVDHDAAQRHRRVAVDDDEACAHGGETLTIR